VLQFLLRFQNYLSNVDADTLRSATQFFIFCLTCSGFLDGEKCCWYRNEKLLSTYIIGEFAGAILFIICWQCVSFSQEKYLRRISSPEVSEWAHYPLWYLQHWKQFNKPVYNHKIFGLMGNGMGIIKKCACWENTFRSDTESEDRTRTPMTTGVSSSRFSAQLFRWAGLE